MLAQALQSEVDAYLDRFVGERDERGRRLVVRNGSHQPREVLTSAGAVEVVAPGVNDRRVDPDTGQRRRFCSAILPPWVRKTPKINKVLPLLCLHGLSSGDFVSACGLMAAKSSSPWPTGTGKRSSPGRICCAMPRGAGCAPRRSPSVTARADFGVHCARCPAGQSAAIERPDEQPQPEAA